MLLWNQPTTQVTQEIIDVIERHIPAGQVHVFKLWVEVIETRHLLLFHFWELLKVTGKI